MWGWVYFAIRDGQNGRAQNVQKSVAIKHEALWQYYLLIV